MKLALVIFRFLCLFLPVSSSYMNSKHLYLHRIKQINVFSNGSKELPSSTLKNQGACRYEYFTIPIKFFAILSRISLRVRV